MASSLSKEQASFVLQKRVTLPKSGCDAIILSLNRPDRLNCFDAEVCQLLSSLVRNLNLEHVAAVILTGQGNSFCAGADLSNPPNPLDQSSDLPGMLENNPVHQMSRLTVPLIGAVQGHVITGGFELALACDILVGNGTTVFRDTHVKFGLAPCWGLSQKLQRKVGPGRAKLASFTAMPIPAKTALQWGLLDDHCGLQNVVERALEIADNIGKNELVMVGRYKRAIDEGGAVTLANGLHRERELGLAHYLEAVNDGGTIQSAKEFILDESRTRMQSNL